MKTPIYVPHRSRKKMLEAFRLANDIHLDLLTGSWTYEIFQRLFSAKPTKEIIEVGVRRLALWYVILTLTKWTEYYDHYKLFIPDDVRSDAKKLRNDINAKGIIKFRNISVGHIWDKETKMPITIKETESRIQQILGPEDIDGFMRWVNDPVGNQFPRNVICVVERVRDGIKEVNGFTENDLMLT